MKDLEYKIKKILNNTLSTEVVTYYPTKADKKRSPYMKPCAEHEVVGMDKAVNKLLKLIKKY